MLQEVSFSLQNAFPVYFPGQTLEGKCSFTMTNDPEVKLKDFGLILIGEATLQMFNGSESQSYIYRKENYFTEYIPFTTDMYQVEHQGPDGTRRYHCNFSYNLPQDIPSSFESENGSVRYSVQLYSIHDKGIFYSPPTYFSISALLDLNKEKKAKDPGTVYARQTVLCSCIRTGPVSVIVHIPQKGYVPGEMIIINAEVNNRRSKPIACVKALLVQVVSYHTSTTVKKIKQVVAQSIRGVVMPFETQVWSEDKLIVPPVAPSYLRHCSTIDIWYRLKFQIMYADSERDIILKIPIIIGTVPLTQSMRKFENSSSVQCLPSDVEGGGDCPVPSCEPCYFGPYHIVDATSKSQTEFSPLYLTYYEAN